MPASYTTCQKQSQPSRGCEMEQVKTSKKEKQAFPAGKADLKSGERRLVEVKGRSVGIFNVNGTYHALHNRCPHMGGATM